MQEIPSEVKTLFESGQFNVRQSACRFNGIWSDLGTEKTTIRDAKSESGIVGLTRKTSALTRWTLTRQLLDAYSKVMRERSGVESNQSTFVHAQLRPAAMARDEKHAQSMVDHIENNMTNPFDIEGHPEEVLVNIATGLHT
jgi:hypothetical protein